jgi:hypothetical protein
MLHDGVATSYGNNPIHKLRSFRLELTIRAHEIRPLTTI